ncbi:glutaminyl-peptide cyclotransferase-like [Belonocnema kinseyi]|uniref:glutaminyl-peptide cyclotransferase-like n=1 Tax=Belonocnema kinseyi TaxID=2817044 RepID=UPI00143D0EEB|nr:glutaminyl-peptide cyclotransferase-like [Belonocnema kinseyi]
MLKLLIFVILSLSSLWVSAQTQISFKDLKFRHVPDELNNAQVTKLANLSNMTHMNEILDNICVVRVVGTPEHKRVRNYIKNSMKELGWTVQVDAFNEDTPNLGRLRFRNIIAKLDPNAKRYLVLACHYDSKYIKGQIFVGATDSAVPCAQLINTAKIMNSQLKSVRNQDVSLMFIFFDGEEAFVNWGPKDSIYGARHLARRWERQTFMRELGNDISELDRMDLLVLLDLIGAPDPKFYSYFEDTERWYDLLLSAEGILEKLELLDKYSYGQPQERYFQRYSIPTYVEDDHIPFLERKVPILHLIPNPFPKTWHTQYDNRESIDLTTTENISKILRLFIASYLHIKV